MVEPGTRVKINNDGSIFGGKIGKVVPMTKTEWEVWVRIDDNILGNNTYGFMERELEIMPDD
jgi:hypothetical protein